MRKFLSLNLFLISLVFAGVTMPSALAASGLLTQVPAPVSNSVCSPTILSNLALWLQSDLGVTQTGGSATNWQDQSSNSYAFAAGGGTNPTWNSSGGPNNAPYFSFTAGAFFSNAVSLFNGTTSNAFTFYVVANSGTLANAPMVMFIKDTSGRGYQMSFWNNPTYQYFELNASTVYPGVRASSIGDFGTASTWYAPSLTYSGTGTSTGNVSNYQFYKSNSSVTTASAGSATDTATATLIGNYKSNDAQRSPGIAFIAMQTSVGTSLERSNMQACINSKYGL